MSALIASAAPSPSAATPAPVPNRVGRFHLLRELGRGAIGAVYLAHDPLIDRSVAVKTFNPRLTPAEKIQYREQFVNEARAAGRLSHPNIVTVFDACDENGVTWIAMEFLQGRELHKLLEAGHRFSHDEVSAIIRKLAEALDYAHGNGVIHRDIKPSNIFLQEGGQPKLVDFGIARAPNRLAAVPADASQPYTLFHRDLLGTPNYMSPEQALGKAVDPRTDLYSLGAVMYEMLTGRKPFAGRDTDQLLQQIAYKAPPTPHELNPAIPAELSHVVMTALAKRPEKRYQSGHDMAQALRRYAARQRRSRRQAQRQFLAGDDDALAAARRPEPHGALFWFGWAALLAALAFTIAALLR